MKFRIEFDRQQDGRWLAFIPALPGVLASGDSKNEAVRQVKAAALHCMINRLESGLDIPENVNNLFAPPANLSRKVTTQTLSSLRTLSVTTLDPLFLEKARSTF